MNPLELNKESETAPVEPIETEISTSNELTETKSEETLLAEVVEESSEDQIVEVPVSTNNVLEKVIEVKPQTVNSKMPDYNLFSKAELINAPEITYRKGDF